MTDEGKQRLNFAFMTRGRVSHGHSHVYAAGGVSAEPRVQEQASYNSRRPAKTVFFNRPQKRFALHCAPISRQL